MLNDNNKNSDVQLEKLRNCVSSVTCKMGSGPGLLLLAEIKEIEKTAKEERDTGMSIVLNRYNNIVKQCNDHWSKLNGDEMIESFEKEWTQWTVDDTIQWFDFVLKMERLRRDNDEPQTAAGKHNSGYDSNSEDYSDESSSSDDNRDDRDDEKERELKNEKNKKSNEIDFQDIKSKLLSTGFRAKKDLAFFVQPFNFKQCGFKNKKDCKILCKQTKKLMEKYPKKRKHKNNKSKKSIMKNQHVDDDYDLEGVVQDTKK